MKLRRHRRTGNDDRDHAQDLANAPHDENEELTREEWEILRGIRQARARFESLSALHDAETIDEIVQSAQRLRDGEPRDEIGEGLDLYGTPAQETILAAAEAVNAALAAVDAEVDAAVDHITRKRRPQRGRSGAPGGRT